MAAHKRAMLPVLGGISGEYRTICTIYAPYSFGIGPPNAARAKNLTYALLPSVDKSFMMI